MQYIISTACTKCAFDKIFQLCVQLTIRPAACDVQNVSTCVYFNYSCEIRNSVSTEHAARSADATEIRDRDVIIETAVSITVFIRLTLRATNWNQFWNGYTFLVFWQQSHKWRSGQRTRFVIGASWVQNHRRLGRSSWCPDGFDPTLIDTWPPGYKSVPGEVKDGLGIVFVTLTYLRTVRLM